MVEGRKDNVFSLTLMFEVGMALEILSMFKSYPVGFHFVS